MDGRVIRGEKLDEIMLPGFRFHPTDEELVGFYLKRKIQQRPLPIELIKQLDIYKYDPWDLPRLATTGEKEWYFYCPRDRKYRNSSRPNRVTGAGFWKATGTDRPIYSSEGSKCIGLKKSLVFYRGRAAKGVKTDWMMHEFRLPSLSDHHSATPNRSFVDNKIIPANDLWAICRIFKKTSSSTHRAASQSWVSPLPTLNDTSDVLPNNFHGNFSSHSIPFSSTTNVFPLDYDLLTQIENIKTSLLLPFLNEPISNSLLLSAMAEASSEPPKPPGDVTSMLLNMSSSVLGHYGAKPSTAERISVDSSVQEHRNTFLPALPQQKEIRVDNKEEGEVNALLKYQNDTGYPLSFPWTAGEAWKSNMFWDYSSSSSSDVSPTLSSITRCYT